MLFPTSLSKGDVLHVVFHTVNVDTSRVSITGLHKTFAIFYKLRKKTYCTLISYATKIKKNVSHDKSWQQMLVGLHILQPSH